MVTKKIKALVNGVVQEIEVNDITSPEQPLSVEERVDTLEDKHEVVITDGNFLVGNGTTELEEMTPEEALEHINGASVVTMTSAEYEALGEDFNANALYMLTDSEDNVAYIDIEDNEDVVNPDVSDISIIIDSSLSETSTNPVQNAVITNELKMKADKAYIIELFEELKILIQNGNSESAIAVLDNAILDLTTLA